MARQFVIASSTELKFSSAPVTAYPMTIAAWVNPTVAALGTAQVIGSVDTSITTNAKCTLFIHQTDGTVGVQSVTSAGAAGAALTTTAMSNGKWGHTCAVFASNTSRSVYLNGGGKASDVSNIAITGMNQLEIGCQTVSGSPAAFFGGSIANFGVWNVALVDAEVLYLAQGVSPLKIRPQNLVFYAPLYGNYPEMDIISQTALINTGTKPSSNVINIGQRQRIIAPFGAPSQKISPFVGRYF